MWRWHDDGALLFGEWWVCGMQRRAMLWRGCRWRRMIFSLCMCVILLCVRRCTGTVNSGREDCKQRIAKRTEALSRSTFIFFKTHHQRTNTSANKKKKRHLLLVNKLMKVNATTIVVSVGVKSDGTLCVRSVAE